ncbi:hypothetical protein PINS_up008249 [Pythium insidiosum]|nr:hypothetical protein PINS_up008249 [Pythium insidiosum]
MSQSLPRLSAFLRPATRVDTDEQQPPPPPHHPHHQQPQHHQHHPPQQQDYRDHKRSAPSSFGGIRATASGGDAMYAAEPPRKRRSNMFVQYGETPSYVSTPPGYHPPPPHHQQHERAMPLHQQPPTASAGVMHARPQLGHPPIYPEQAPLVEMHRAGRSFTPEPRRPPHDRDANAVTPVTADASRPETSTPPRVQQRERTSRYLSEEDRREIILRIDKGEKQVALAKEYQVSRAAICNLYKNRREVMIRVDRNPKAKHPKRSKSKDANVTPPSFSSSSSSALTAPTVMDDTGTRPKLGNETPTPTRPALVVADADSKDSEPAMDDEHSDCSTTSNMSSNDHRSTVWMVRRASDSTTVSRTLDRHGARVLGETSLPIRRLMETLRDRRLPLAAVRRTTKRVVHGLLEEAAACITQRAADQPAFSDSDIIGVSLEDPSGVMLQTFTDIFESSTALVSSDKTWPKSITRLAGQAAKAVIVMDTDSISGERALAALRHLSGQQEGLSASRIAVVSWVTSPATLDAICTDFPDVVVISASVLTDGDSSLDAALLDMSSRFLGPSSSIAPLLATSTAA